MNAQRRQEIKEENEKAIEAIKEAGSGIYNSYDEGISGYEAHEVGLKYTYVSPSGEEYTRYFTIVVGENIDENSYIGFDTFGSGVYSDGKYLDAYNYDAMTEGVIKIRPAYYSPNGIGLYNAGPADEIIDALMSDIAEVYGISQDNSNVMGFSSTANDSISMGIQRAMTGHKNVVINCIEIAPDQGYPQITAEQRQALIDNNAVILNIHATSYRSLLESRRNYLNDYNGVHTIDISFNVEGVEDPHGLIYRYLVCNGLTDEGKGFDWSTLPEKWVDPFDNQEYSFSCIITEYYLDENGNYVSRVIDDPSMLNLIIDGALVTDFSTLESSMNTLYNCAKKSSFIESESISCDFLGDTSIPLDEPGIVNNLLASLTNLIGKIKNEIEQINIAGDSIKNIEKNLIDEAMTLGMQITGSVSAEVPIIDFSVSDIDELYEQLDSCEEEAISSLIDMKEQLSQDVLDNLKTNLDRDLDNYIIDEEPSVLNSVNDKETQKKELELTDDEISKPTKEPEPTVEETPTPTEEPTSYDPTVIN